MLRFHVPGMTCGGCVKAVTRAVHGIAPGASVDVDLATKLVIVSGASLDSPRIASAIEGGGFSVEARPA
jgi:copper chaperone